MGKEYEMNGHCIMSDTGKIKSGLPMLEGRIWDQIDVTMVMVTLGSTANRQAIYRVSQIAGDIVPVILLW